MESDAMYGTDFDELLNGLFEAVEHFPVRPGQPARLHQPQRGFRLLSPPVPSPLDAGLKVETNIQE